MTNLLISHKSRNVKTGPITVTTSDANTCPVICPFKSSNACYAKHGPLGMLWGKMDTKNKTIPNGRNKVQLKQFADLINQIDAGKVSKLWRHNQAGDLIPLKGNNRKIDRRKLAALVKANKDANLDGFTYTHHDTALAHNRQAIAHANANGFAVNLSGNDIAHADRLKALNIGPVVTVIPENEPIPPFTPAGNRLVVCPAQTQENMSCAKCKLCSRQRDSIVAFIAHGPAKARIQ